MNVPWVGGALLALGFGAMLARYTHTGQWMFRRRRISVDPAVNNGRPSLGGVAVSDVFTAFDANQSLECVSEQYPQLSRDDLELLWQIWLEDKLS